MPQRRPGDSSALRFRRGITGALDIADYTETSLAVCVSIGSVDGSAAPPGLSLRNTPTLEISKAISTCQVLITNRTALSGGKLAGMCVCKEVSLREDYGPYFSSAIELCGQHHLQR